MISSKHAIWKFAYANGETDDWLPYAEELVMEWADLKSVEVKFRSTFEIILAGYLLKDNLLPASARVAFSEVMLETINEASTNKLRIDCLHIEPPKPGRKQDRTKHFIQFHEVRSLIQEGKTATEAYKMVAEKHFKSSDTIRREFERANEKLRKRKVSGEND